MFSEVDCYIGFVVGYFYVVFIFSFLGGLWWGVVVSWKDVFEWLYFVVVVFSLIVFVFGILWMIGVEWSGLLLGLLGIGLIVLIMIDRILFR